MSIQTERELNSPCKGSAVGIDMGVPSFATSPDGSFYAPRNSVKRHETALRKAQQAMSRKTKFSNNWKRKSPRQRIHSNIGNAAATTCTRPQTTISKNHAMGVYRGLTGGTCQVGGRHVDPPGRKRSGQVGPEQVHSRSGLVRFRAVNWTTSWRGTADTSSPCRRSTSRTCPCCSHVSAENRQTPCPQAPRCV